MIKKFIVVSAIVLATTIGASPVVSAATPNTNITKTENYSKKKKNQFWSVAKSISPAVKSIGKEKTIINGISTCNLLRSGVTKLLVEVDSEESGYAAFATIASATAILCPDQQSKVLFN